MRIDETITPEGLLAAIRTFWDLSGRKIELINREFDPSDGSPVFTAAGKYTTRGWTEWTQGFQFGAELLQFDATDEAAFLERGRTRTRDTMAPHVTHFGVHDHGFNNISTYGNLLRLMTEGRFPADENERAFYALALRASGAVQAHRWTALPDGGGFIYSFNGPHSLFADTIRSLRSLAVAHRLGQSYLGEHDRNVSLLERLIHHARTTADTAVYYGTGRDAYDVRGRTAHESIFNINDGKYRCPNTQQGYSPFSTWTRGLAWIMLGYAEELEFLATVTDAELEPWGGRDAIETFMRGAATATCDFYIANSASDGVPYWDTGAPNLHKLGPNYLGRPADPFNDAEPVDASAAAIAAQALLRLGHYLDRTAPTAHAPNSEETARPAEHYTRAGLTVLRTLLHEPYLSTAPNHQGLLLHSIYHRPNGWDYVPDGRTIPCGESSMWGDYHIREAALYVQRLAQGGTYLTFFHGAGPTS